MTLPRHWLTVASDPLPQLMEDHPTCIDTDHLIAFSQTAALIHWSTIEAHAGTISIVLRRIAQEGDEEWRDHLAMLRQLLQQSGKAINLWALGRDAAAALSTEVRQPVRSMPDLRQAFRGERSMMLSRVSGSLRGTTVLLVCVAAQSLKLMMR